MVTFQEVESKDRKKLRRLQARAATPQPTAIGAPLPQLPSPAFAPIGGVAQGDIGQPFPAPSLSPLLHSRPRMAPLPSPSRGSYGEELALPPAPGQPVGVPSDSAYARAGALGAGESLKRLTLAPIQFLGEAQELAAAELFALGKVQARETPASQLGDTKENLAEYRKLPLAARLLH